MNLSNYEIGWLVGLLEGEGCFDFTRTQRIKLEMVDEDTIIAYANLVSRFLERHIDVRYQSREGNKQDSYLVSISGDSARKLMRLVVPYMHFRRRQKIWQALNQYRAPKTKIKFDIKTLLSTAMQKELTNDRHNRDARQPAEPAGTGSDAGRDDQGSVAGEYDPYGQDESGQIH